MVIDKDAELMRYEECVKEYTELLDDLTLVKKGKDVSATEFVNRCDDCNQQDSKHSNNWEFMKSRLEQWQFMI